MLDYYEDIEECPHCTSQVIHWRDCTECGWQDGWIDMCESYDEGDVEMCQECLGTGIQKWCPQCGHDPRQKHKKG